jgi:pimeloyl-ACP methyl ester carboxylesterase
MRRFEVNYSIGETRFRLRGTEWGDPAAPVVICVHGLTRNGRDFDVLAAALADRFRVLCPDLPGRGGSDWLPGPEFYVMPSYVAALGAVLRQAGGAAAWVGTSLGGLCGLALAAGGAGLTRLLLNDIGPFIPAAALARIADYMARAPAAFADPAALEAALRVAHAPFGPLSDAQWADMARHSARPLPDGRVALHYDPAITVQVLATPPADVDLWPLWGRVSIPRLVLRGAASDLLAPETFARMLAEGARGHVVAGAGHAPALMDAPTIAVARRFLEEGLAAGD